MITVKLGNCITGSYHSFNFEYKLFKAKMLGRETSHEKNKALTSRVQISEENCDKIELPCEIELVEK